MTFDRRTLAGLPRSGGSITGDLAVAGRLTNAGFRLPSMLSPVRRPQWRQATTAMLMQSGHGWTVGGGGTASSNANDTTAGSFIRGTQAITVTTAANATQSQVRKLAMSAMDLTGKAIRLTIKIDDVTHLNRIEFLIGTSTFANFYRYLVHTHAAGATNWIQSGEWVTITLNWADIAASGGTYTVGSNGAPSSRTGFTDMQLNVYDDGLGAVTYHFQSVELIPDTTTVFAGGVASVTFDDSWASQYSLARPKMDANGQRGTLYTIAEYIGLDNNHMAVGDLRTLQDYSGWEVAGHAYSASAHGQPNGYSSLSAAQVHDEFTRMKLWLASNGLTGNNFAYPKGHFEVTTDGVPVDQIAAGYWATSRTIISENKESFPPAQPQRIRAMTGINDGTGLGGTTVTALTAAGGPLDRCQNAGDWLILCVHEIVTGTPADSTQCSQTGFNTVMDALASRSIPVRPVNEVISYYT